MTDTVLSDEGRFLASTPCVRGDALARHYDNEIVAWSPLSPLPAYLDPVSALVYQLLDGTATVGEIVHDVHDVVGVPAGIARDQIRRVVSRLESAQLLATSQPRGRPPGDADDLGVFLGPPNP